MLMKVAGKPAITSSMGVAENVFPHDLLFTDALGARGNHVLFADLIEKRIFGQHRQRRKAANHRRQHRQSDMPEIVGDFFIPRQGAEVG
ncbi:Uncharacterised protein [Enterobacter cancerogenus]|uniref:Uncharacterized protein n=1 Tax=Enterobacter cancerogenus TaxID=69218 RepID=A0A484ZET8_9ENTR|nr:Uncharacterised protein [Enterobacter cancerogenus]